MKSVSAKITLWSVVALAISLAVFLAVAQHVIGASIKARFDRFNALHFEQARTAFEAGGSGGLSRYLRKLNLPGREAYYLTDALGKDLKDGADHSDLVKAVAGESGAPIRRNGQMILGAASEDGRYFWIAVEIPPPATSLASFYAIVLATVGALYWLVATRIASPLRRLAKVVDRLGQGDLTARAETRSEDEVGDLGRSVNAMAERIQTLLTAERQLLQDVSHELRSPLARLSFEAEMVRKTSDRQASASRLQHEIDRLSELVGTLIDMARAEGDPASVEIEDIRIGDLLHVVADECAVEATAKGCVISVEARDDVDVRGNSELLRRAIENILRNAIRYSPKGATVEAGSRLQGFDAVISVRDYGPGIRGDLAAHIFDPFFREDKSRNGGTGGLGLGLAIARRAIRVHHGDIKFENARPGALFEITIPAART